MVNVNDSSISRERIGFCHHRHTPPLSGFLSDGGEQNLPNGPQQRLECYKYQYDTWCFINLYCIVLYSNPILLMKFTLYFYISSILFHIGDEVCPPLSVIYYALFICFTSFEMHIVHLLPIHLVHNMPHLQWLKLKYNDMTTSNRIQHLQHSPQWRKGRWKYQWLEWKGKEKSEKGL